MNGNPHEPHADPRPHEVPGQPEQPNPVRPVPEAVAAADVAKRTSGSNAESTEAEVEQMLQQHRARGLEWVRPTDLIARNSAAMAGRGIDLETELARKARAPMVAGLKSLGERARRLPPVSAFGHGVRHHAPTRAAVGKS